MSETPPSCERTNSQKVAKDYPPEERPLYDVGTAHPSTTQRLQELEMLENAYRGGNSQMRERESAHGITIPRVVPHIFTAYTDPAAAEAAEPPLQAARVSS